jgi:hypothetical protein
VNSDANIAPIEANLTYVLGDREVSWRARSTAAVASLATFLPTALVVVLLVKMGFLIGTFATVLVALGGVLAIARGFAEARRLTRSLRVFSVTASDAALLVKTKKRALRIERAMITRAREIGGALGGLRIELSQAYAPDATWPEWADIPRGGEHFGELRAHIESWTPIERPQKRVRAARIAIGVAIVAAIFFVPFVLDDVIGRSRAGAFAIVAVVWIVIRIAMRRV